MKQLPVFIRFMMNLSRINPVDKMPPAGFYFINFVFYVDLFAATKRGNVFTLRPLES